MKNDKGLTLLPVVIGLVVSLIAIIVILVTVVTRSNEEEKRLRLIATQMSDYGFQTITEQITAIEDLAKESFVSTDTTFEGEGWYKIDVQKSLRNDTMDITVNSVGGAGNEVVSQQKQFQLLRLETDSGAVWSALGH